ncbi:MAG: FKBP-type peptidyl-prolyl cis-trans isomerase [Bacteroidetes bacterium]|nr:FKBP-type peptidyl-prolyl cis-trans isomerase [Bacteroidota bacterium]
MIKTLITLLSIAILATNVDAQNGKKPVTAPKQTTVVKKTTTTTVTTTPVKTGVWITTPSGMKYIYYKKKSTTAPKVGDVVELHFMVLTEKDSILQSTFDEMGSTKGQCMPIEMQEPKATADMMQAFRLFGEGDSGAVMIKSDEIFVGDNKDKRPPFFPVGSYIKYIIRPVKIYNKDDYMKIMQEKQVETPGTGDVPKKGQTISVLYTGKLLSGKIFDATSNRGNEPFTFKIGTGQVIKGWDEGMIMFKKGGKGKLIIPSRNGYGEQGAGADIPPNSPLLFEIEVLDIKD